MSDKRNTNQKEVILDALGYLNHPTAEELLDAIIKKQGSFSKATLYRNLSQFLQDGLVEKVCLDCGAIRYEIPCGFHYHLVCNQCGRVDNLVLPKPLVLPARLMGYDIEGHSLVFHGKCSKCQGK